MTDALATRTEAPLDLVSRWRPEPWAEPIYAELVTDLGHLLAETPADGVHAIAAATRALA